MFSEREIEIIAQMANCAVHGLVFNNPMYKPMATKEELGAIIEKARKM
jgi:hypothetical protein